jgi:RND family efflux transporter MFP subunit
VVVLTSTTKRRTISVPGELRPLQEVRLFPKTSGFVQSVSVDRGSVVHAGQELARLEAPELTAQLAEAASRAQSAEAMLTEAQARAQGSSASLVRVRAAAATVGVVAPDELERAQTTARADSARLVSARSQVDAARSARQATAEISEYLVVKAPFAGIITERNIHPGALVGPASGATVPLFRIEDASSFRLVVALPEAYIGATAVSEVATFQVRAYPADTFRATLARRSGTLDPRTRTELLEFDVRQGKERLEAGMYADVLIPVGRATATFVVPKASVGTSVTGPFVIALDGDQTRWIPVRKAESIGDSVEVFGALHVGDRLVARATDEIRSGMRVQVVKGGP